MIAVLTSLFNNDLVVRTSAVNEYNKVIFSNSSLIISISTTLKNVRVVIYFSFIEIEPENCHIFSVANEWL